MCEKSVDKTTDDAAHGQQELALFNGYDDTWCYLPLIATVTFTPEPIQHVVAALLRPGPGHLPQAFPGRDTWHQLAQALTAT